MEQEYELNESIDTQIVVWEGLYSKCEDCILSNIHFVLQYQAQCFLELKHFEDPIKEYGEDAPG
jgi:hypothetical protein